MQPANSSAPVDTVIRVNTLCILTLDRDCRREVYGCLHTPCICKLGRGTVYMRCMLPRQDPAIMLQQCSVCCY